MSSVTLNLQENRTDTDSKKVTLEERVEGNGR